MLLNPKGTARRPRPQGLKLGLERRWVAAYGLLFLIGLGSAAFHGTLTWLGQAADELPMIWAALQFLFVIREDAREPRYWWLPSLLVTLLVLLTTIYLYLQQYFAFFLASYLAVVLSIFASAFVAARAAPPRSRTTERNLALVACLSYASGFLLFWIPENLFCETLRPLNLHAWFHLTSVVGPYCFLVFACYHRLVNLRRRPELRYAGGVLPFVHVHASAEKGRRERP